MAADGSIGKYHLESRLGSGSFASVWLAYDPDLDARVAIKVLADNWSQNEEIKRRFLNEARVLWRIDDPRVIRVYTTGEFDDGRPYFVMEYADRGTLYDRMVSRFEENGIFPVQEALRISRQIAGALSVIHGIGIVHRDLKPSNILYRSGMSRASGPASWQQPGDETAQMMLADFGIARQLEAASSFTITAGTLHYMAPEQADPSTAGQADHRSDLYAAAVILFELLTGRVPFPYDSLSQILRAHMSETPPNVAALRDDVPDYVSALVSRGIATSPDDRYTSAQEWAEALDRAIEMIAEPGTGEETLFDHPQEAGTITERDTILDPADDPASEAADTADVATNPGRFSRLPRSPIIIGCAALLLLLTCTSTAGALVYLESRGDDGDTASSTATANASSTLEASSIGAGAPGTQVGEGEAAPTDTPDTTPSPTNAPPTATETPEPTATSEPTPTNTSVPPTPTDTPVTAQFTPAEQRVVNHFRLADWGQTCERNNAPATLLSAQIGCTFEEVSTLFQEYFSAEGLNQDIQTFQQFPGAQTSPWSRDGVTAGTLVELIDEDGSAVLFWSEDADLMSGLAIRADGNQAVLHEWWLADSYHSFSASISP